MTQVSASDTGRIMLGTVRVARGLTQSKLAQLAGISQGALSKAESGLVPLDHDRLVKLANALEVPPGLVSTPISEAGPSSQVFHRKRSTFPISKANRLRAELDLLHIQVAGILGSRGPQVRLERTPLPEDGFDSPEDIAREVRVALGLPTDRVEDLVRTLESAGVVVVRRQLRSTQIDAVVSWPESRRPLILLSDQAPGDRQRFTLAHELAHAVMHQLPTEGQESEADRFASELLMPAAVIRDQLDEVSIPRLVTLKSHWGVSMAALLRRGRDLGTVSEAQYRAMNIELSRAGYRTSEPGQVAHERPTLLSGVIQDRIAGGETVADIARSAQMRTAEFAELYLEGNA